jgi:RNA polymerase sigma-70 factor, ECF subfamily
VRGSVVPWRYGGRVTQTAVSVEFPLEEFRGELTGYCYRMLGSAFEAEDAVQETMVRAWRGLDRFEGRAALRSWLYRIATNVCLTMLGSPQRRARPMDLGPATSGLPSSVGPPLPESVWVGPVPDTVASVNSALQRARATLATADLAADPVKPMDDEQRTLLARYVEAFERYDIAALTALLHDDATLNMPPLPLWFRGHADIATWMSGHGRGCAGSRLIPTVANGMPAFGQYRPAATADPTQWGGPACTVRADGGHLPWALTVLEISAGRIKGISNFLDTARLFPLFGLPDRLDPVHPVDR